MCARATGQIRGVLFDWDGTLLNSYRADSDAYLAMFREMGIPWTLDDLARPLFPQLVSRLSRRKIAARSLG